MEEVEYYSRMDNPLMLAEVEYLEMLDVRYMGYRVLRLTGNFFLSEVSENIEVSY